MGLRMRPNAKKLSYYALAFLLIYWCFMRQSVITKNFEFHVPDSEPKRVWEFWADFSNYKKINPTVIDFEIDHEHGTYENWEYGVTFTEWLLNFPSLTLVIKGRYIVTPEQTRGHFHEPYRILSEHTSCVYFYCIHTDTDMTFALSGDGKGTKISETVTFSASPITAWLSVRDLKAQRDLIKQQMNEIDFQAV